jgi:pSer/pThr/pTyr-binding forkhead associated (FHA) protein
MPIRLLLTQTAAAAGTDGSKAAPQELKLDGDEILIGRDKTCQVSLPEQSVSRNHARITRDGSLYFVEDSGSAFGTRVNGQVLPKGEKRLLRNGDIIAVGTFDIAFSRALEVTQPASDGEGESTSAVARAVVKDALRGLGAEGGPYLRVMNGPLEGRRFEVNDASELVVGRQDTCSIILDDDLTSRKHAKIRRDWTGTHVEDLGSRNGVKVNRKLIKEPTTLKDRDEVEIGGTRLLYVDPTEVPETPLVTSLAVPALERPPEPAPKPERPKSSPRAEPSKPPLVEARPPEPEPPPPEPEPEPEAEAEPEPEPEPEPPGAELAALDEGTEVQPPSSRAASWLSKLPRDREALMRVLPLLIAGAVVVVGLVVLILVFV